MSIGLLLLGLMVAVCCLIVAMGCGLAWLFSSHRTLAALAGVLTVLVLLPLLGLLFLFLGSVHWVRPRFEPSPVRPTSEIGDRPMRVAAGTAHVRPPAAAGPDVPAPASLPAAGRPAQSGGLLRMLSGALLRALEDEDGPQPGGAPASETPRVEAAEADALTPTSPASSAPRPAWIDSAPHREGSDYQVSIVVGPYTTREECDKKLPEELLRAVDAYAVNFVNPRASGRVQLPLDYLQGSLIRDTWEERRVFPLSPSLHRPMVQLHALLGFDAKAVEKIRKAWTQIVVEQRVYRLAAVGIVLLLSLTIAWAYLRLDLSTAGRYRWRLRLAAAAALVAVVFFGLTLS
jgi:hypothetical protein